MNECLTTPQHKNKSAIGCQTNGSPPVTVVVNLMESITSVSSRTEEPAKAGRYLCP